MAAEQGYAAAQTYLGIRYVKGEGITKDVVEAARWFRLAAERNYAEAQLLLGAMYGEGEGVPQDDVQAYAWFIVAATQGSAVAKEYREYKELITERMTDSEIAAAEKLAHEFWEAYVLPFRE